MDVATYTFYSEVYEHNTDLAVIRIEIPKTEPFLKLIFSKVFTWLSPSCPPEDGGILGFPITRVVRALLTEQSPGARLLCAGKNALN